MRTHGKPLARLSFREVASPPSWPFFPTPSAVPGLCDVALLRECACGTRGGARPEPPGTKGQDSDGHCSDRLGKRNTTPTDTAGLAPPVCRPPAGCCALQRIWSREETPCATQPPGQPACSSASYRRAARLHSRCCRTALDQMLQFSPGTACPLTLLAPFPCPRARHARLSPPARPHFPPSPGPASARSRSGCTMMVSRRACLCLSLLVTVLALGDAAAQSPSSGPLHWAFDTAYTYE